MPLRIRTLFIFAQRASSTGTLRTQARDEVNGRFTAIEQRLDTFASQTIQAFAEAKTIAVEAKKGNAVLEESLESIRTKISDDMMALNEAIQNNITDITINMSSALKEATNNKQTLKEHQDDLKNYKNENLNLKKEITQLKETGITNKHDDKFNPYFFEKRYMLHDS